MSPFNNKSPKLFFLFEEPMVAKGREETMLGVAFESAKKGTRARYTPQGPSDSADPEEIQKNNSTPPGYFQSLINYVTGTAEGAAAPPVVAAQQPQPGRTTGEPITYKTPCAWPKDLGVNNIYPRNGPTIAVGVEEIRANIKDAQIAGRVIAAVSFGLKVSKEKLETVHIPILRRHTMEDPRGKIEDLLDVTDYRERLIRLFEEQHTPGEKKLYIATAVIACAGVSLQSSNKGEQEFKGHGKDPTQTIPVSAGIELRHLRERAQKGEYESEIVLCASYHQIRYKFEPQEPVGLFGRRQARRNEHDPDAIRYPWGNGTAIFRIEKDEAKGDVPAFFGCEDDPSSPQRVDTNDSLCEPSKGKVQNRAIFEDARMEDSDAGAEQSEDENSAAPVIKAPPV